MLEARGTPSHDAMAVLMEARTRIGSDAVYTTVCTRLQAAGIAERGAAGKGFREPSAYQNIDRNRLLYDHASTIKSYLYI